MKKKIVLVFDALPYEKVKGLNEYNKQIKFSKLETIPGYSDGIYPSIWTGLSPTQTNFWSPFKFIEQKRDGREIDDHLLGIIYPLLKRIPYKINPYASIAICNLFEKILKREYPFPPFYNFSMNHLFYYDNYFDYVMNPDKFNKNHSSIFSLLKERLLKFDYIFTYDFGIKMSKLFEKSKNHIIFYLNPVLDSFGHIYGTNSVEYNNKLLSILEWIKILLMQDNYEIVIFSDHGMTNIYKQFKPLPILKNLKLKHNKDIIVWLDSTMVRMWLWNDKSKNLRGNIISEFMDQGLGFFYNLEISKKYGLDFNNRAYGDLIFQVDPHYEIFPNQYNYLNIPQPKGMHGYVPTHKDSYGVFYSNQNLSKNPKSVLDIYKYLQWVLF